MMKRALEALLHSVEGERERERERHTQTQTEILREKEGRSGKEKKMKD